MYACQAHNSRQRVRFSTLKEEPFNETFLRSAVRQHGCGRTLCEKMKNISKQANHSIGSTSVPIIYKSGFEARRIMAQLAGIKSNQVVGVTAKHTCHEKETCRKRCRSS